MQPLAGEFAVSRDLLLRTPFLTGYGVEIAILIHVLGAVGLPAMAQVGLGSRQNRHQPLWDLTRMSSAVLRALARGARPSRSGARAPGARPVGPARTRRPGDLPATRSPPRTACVSDEHLTELLERPPMAQVLSARQEIPAYQANMYIWLSYGCATLPDRAVFDKSHNRLASSARRLVIEATYPL